MWVQNFTGGYGYRYKVLPAGTSAGAGISCHPLALKNQRIVSILVIISLMGAGIGLKSYPHVWMRL